MEAADQLEESERGMFCNIKKQDRFAEYEVNKLLSESSASENASRLNVVYKGLKRIKPLTLGNNPQTKPMTSHNDHSCW